MLQCDSIQQYFFLVTEGILIKLSFVP